MAEANDIVTPDQIRASAQGAANQASGREFERLVEESFKSYLDSATAWLARMPNPTVPSQMRDKNGAPLYRLSGRPPFDIYGYWCSTGRFPGRMIGAECKHTNAPESSLPIIAPEKRGSGLQYHQLEALANLARSGGTAKVLWDNGGQWSMLSEGQIVVAHEVYLSAMQTELCGKTPPMGSKSIPFASFQEVKARAFGHRLILDWLSLA